MIYQHQNARSNLYYGAYQFAMHVYIKDAYSLRYPAEKIHALLIWKYQTRTGHAYPDSVAHVPDLIDFKQWLDKQQDIKLVVFSNWAYIYGNQADLAQALQDLDYIENVFVHEANVVLPHDVILRKDPKWRYRSYFRERFLGDDRGTVLSRFLINRADCFGYSNTLGNRMRGDHGLRRSQSHYFVEHNDLRDITMLDLVCPGIIRKTLPIQAK